jgi:hypothetical protein
MGKKKGFQPTQNFIANAVRNNYRKAMQVSTYHINALTAEQSDPDIAALLAAYTPVHSALSDLLSEKSQDTGSRISRTQRVKNLLKELSHTHVPDWQQAIGNTYRRRSPGFTSLFPSGTKVFSNGSIESRIAATDALAKACLADSSAAVQAVGATISAFYNTLLDARSAQSGKKSEVGTDIAQYRTAIDNMCTAQFANVGMLIYKFAANPIRVNAFLDLTELKQHPHSGIYKGMVHAGRKKKVCVAKMHASGTLTITNHSDADMRLWLAKTSKSKVHAMGIVIPKRTSSMQIPVAQIGQSAHRVLMMENLDVATDGSYTIDVSRAK